MITKSFKLVSGVIKSNSPCHSSGCAVTYHPYLSCTAFMYLDFAEMSFTGLKFQPKDLKDNSKIENSQIRISYQSREKKNFIR